LLAQQDNKVFKKIQMTITIIQIVIENFHKKVKERGWQPLIIFIIDKSHDISTARKRSSTKSGCHLLLKEYQSS